jgi:hypothetical protein
MTLCLYIHNVYSSLGQLKRPIQHNQKISSLWEPLPRAPFFRERIICMTNKHVDMIKSVKKPQIFIFTLFSIIYSVGNMLCAPIDCSIASIQVIDAFYPLTIIFGLPSPLGVALGNVIASLCVGFSYFGVLKSIFVSVCVAHIGWKVTTTTFSRSLILATAVQGMILSCSYVLTPFENCEQPFDSTIKEAIGSIITVNVIGYLGLKTIHRRITA